MTDTAHYDPIRGCVVDESAGMAECSVCCERFPEDDLAICSQCGDDYCDECAAPVCPQLLSDWCYACVDGGVPGRPWRSRFLPRFRRVAEVVRALFADEQEGG